MTLYRITSGSMEPTLPIGSLIIAASGAPIQGQVIVFRHPVTGNVSCKRVARVEPDERLFLRGDNPKPDASWDSRHWGGLDTANVIGVGRIRVWRKRCPDHTVAA